jgi:hypothetical protein
MSKPLPPRRPAAELPQIPKFSGGGERELAMDVRIRPGLAVRAPRTAGFGASAQSLVDDGPDGARASATFGAATEAVIDLLGAAREVNHATDGAADIVVGDDVTGTNNHEIGRSQGDATTTEILKSTAGCKRKKRLFK